MKILLVNPSQRTVYGKPMALGYAPLGLLYIAAVLEKAGHEIRLLDVDAEGCSADESVRLLESFQPEMVGVTATTPTIKAALAFANMAKTACHDISVVLGGIHPTISPEETLANDYVDFVVIGEGEITVVELAQAQENRTQAFACIAGLGYKKNGNIILNDARTLIEDLDSIPFPARHLLEQPKAYLPPDAMQVPVISIMTNRGCYGKCTFCCTKQIFGQKLRVRSVNNIIAEIEDCIARYGTREVHIADDNFVVTKNRVREFCGAVRKIDKKLIFAFMNGLRADTVDEEVLRNLKSIGFHTLGFGVESGSEEILKRMKKGISLDTYRNVFRLTKKFGFHVWAFFIFGLPGETAQTIRQTVNFAKELDPDFAKFLILKPYPGSEVFEYLSSQNLIACFDYDYYGVYTKPVHRLPGLTSEEIQMWHKRAFREFYFRPRKILQHLLRIRSLHQLRFKLRSLLFVLHSSK